MNVEYQARGKQYQMNSSSQIIIVTTIFLSGFDDDDALYECFLLTFIEKKKPFLQ